MYRSTALLCFHNGAVFYNVKICIVTGKIRTGIWEHFKDSFKVWEHQHDHMIMLFTEEAFWIHGELQCPWFWVESWVCVVNVSQGKIMTIPYDQTYLFMVFVSCQVLFWIAFIYAFFNCLIHFHFYSTAHPLALLSVISWYISQITLMVRMRSCNP